MKNISLILFIFALCYTAQGKEFTAIALPFEEVKVPSPVKGVIKKINIKEGEPVKAGIILAELENEEENLQVERYSKIAERRRIDHETTQELLKKNVSSQDEALEKKIEWETAENQLLLAKAVLRKKTIKSPLDGIVVEKFLEVGEWVDPGTPICEVINIDKVYARILLEAKDLFQIKLQQEVTVRFPAIPGDNQYSGKIDFIDSRIDEASGLLKIKILINNKDKRIRSGMEGIVTLP